MTLWTPHIHGISNGETVEVLTQLTTIGEFGVHIGLVDLDDKGDLAEGLISRDGSVGSLDALAIGTGEFEGYVLPDGKAEFGGGSLEGKGEATRVVTDAFLLDELEGLEFLGVHC
mmetsp:Transcript_2460/g.3358  ORF Transcript_2460/g.3358 Transcript_2460/m.3358 type:complete len:115 (-) Transcript_2460:293-637(-)